MFNVCHHDRNDTSKTLNSANQTDIPNKQCISVSCFSSIETEAIFFMIPFAVADINYNILGTPFFERSKQKIQSEHLIG